MENGRYQGIENIGWIEWRKKRNINKPVEDRRARGKINADIEMKESHGREQRLNEEKLRYSME